ncbi:MAG: DUF58 domain-containing protein [Planctomycetia bacterium]
MTHASPPSLSPELVARIDDLEVRARAVVEGTVSGRHRSPFFGRSVEFAQHREYVPGDDPRHIDWKVLAKGDRLYVKQYEDETNLRATLAVDASASMDYGVGDQHKFTFACRLTAALSFLLLRQSDGVALVGFADGVVAETPLRNSSGHLHTVLHALALLTPAKTTDAAGVFARLADRDPRRGLLVVVSDLLTDADAVAEGLRLLRRRRHDVVVLHVLHDDELDFPFEGTTRFEGLESTLGLTCDPRSLRVGYLAAVEQFLNGVRAVCGRAGVDYRLVRTSTPVDAVLAALLTERLRR